VTSIGNGNEVKVHTIGGRNPETKLDQEIHDWLAQHALAEIIDIKYGYCQGYYSAMIVYRSM
jgi:hypothetical protein